MKIVKIVIAIVAAFMVGSHLEVRRANKHFMPKLEARDTEINDLRDENLKLEDSRRKLNVALELSRVRAKTWRLAAQDLDRGMTAYEVQQKLDDISEFTKLIPRMMQ